MPFADYAAIRDFTLPIVNNSLRIKYLGIVKQKALFIAFVFIYALIAPCQYCSGQESSRDPIYSNGATKDIYATTYG
jgi:hypothetical protein